MADESGWSRREKVAAHASTSSSQGQNSETAKKIRIVIAEDNPGDVLLIREALELGRVVHELVVHRDGQQMLHYIERMDRGEAPCPDVVLLDLNLPKKNGETLLIRMRRSPICAHVPVVIVTSSDRAIDREKMTQLGANTYFRKSSNYDEFMQLGTIVKQLVTESA